MRKQQILQKQVPVSVTKTARKAVRRAPLPRLRVSVAPRTAPSVQFVQNPRCRSSTVNEFEVAELIIHTENPQSDSFIDKETRLDGSYSTKGTRRGI